MQLVYKYINNGDAWEFNFPQRIVSISYIYFVLTYILCVHKYIFQYILFFRFILIRIFLYMYCIVFVSQKNCYFLGMSSRTAESSLAEKSGTF